MKCKIHLCEIKMLNRIRRTGNKFLPIFFRFDVSEKLIASQNFALKITSASPTTANNQPKRSTCELRNFKRLHKQILGYLLTSPAMRLAELKTPNFKPFCAEQKFLHPIWHRAKTLTPQSLGTVTTIYCWKTFSPPIFEPAKTQKAKFHTTSALSISPLSTSH